MYCFSLGKKVGPTSQCAVSIDREKSGRAFVYHPRYTRQELLSGLAGEALEAVFGQRARDLQPILSFFVETVSREDRESLEALEKLVEERRRVSGRTQENP